jgi:hypothetical protein
MTLILENGAIPRDRRFYDSRQITRSKTENALLAQRSFKEFRGTVRPGMKRNWMTEIITMELQGFYNAFVGGMRPKLAIEMPPQHGKLISDDTPVLTMQGVEQ